MASLHKMIQKRGIAYRVRYYLNGKQCTEHLPINLPRASALTILTEFNRRLALHKAGKEQFYK